MPNNSFLTEPHGPIVRLAASDPVWIAAVKRAWPSWIPYGTTQPPLEVFPSWEAMAEGDETPDAELLLAEVGRDDLQQVAGALAQRSRYSNWRVIALLRRIGADRLTTPADRAPAAALLHEAGVSLSIASPRELPRVLPIAVHLFNLDAAVPADPLEQLPLACWGPGWQTVGTSDRLNDRRQANRPTTGRD